MDEQPITPDWRANLLKAGYTKEAAEEFMAELERLEAEREEEETCRSILSG